jgi:hypothetical protein
MTAFQRKRIQQIQREIERRGVTQLGPVVFIPPSWAGKFMFGCAIVGALLGTILHFFVLK